MNLPGPSPFGIELSRTDAGVTVTPTGELDLASAPELERTIMEAVDRGDDVLLDLRALEFCDSSGIRVLLQVAEAARSDGRGLRIVRPPEGGPVDRILVVAGVDRGLDFVDPE